MSKESRESEKQAWIQRIKKELSEYQIGDWDLDVVFEPLLIACAKVTNKFDDFKQCILEGISTLKSVISKK